MKKLIALLLALLMVFSMVACGQKEDAPAAQEETKTEDPKEEAKEEVKEEAPAEKPYEGTTLKFWTAPLVSDDVDKAFWDKQFEDFTAKTGAKVETEVVGWGDMGAKYLTGFMADQAADVMYMTSELSYEFISQDLLLDVTPYWSEEEIANENFWDAFSFGDAHYQLAFAGGSSYRGMIYNMDILKECGVTELPTTWEEFLDVCEAVKTGRPDVYVFMSPQIGNVSVAFHTFIPFMAQAGGWILNDENTAYTINTPEGLEAMNFIKTLADNGYISADCLGIEDTGARDLFAEGKAAIMYDAAVQMVGYDIPFEWEASSELSNKRAVSWNAIDSISVNANSKNVDAAVELLKYVRSAEVQANFAEEIYASIPLCKDWLVHEYDPHEEPLRAYPERAVLTPVAPNINAVYESIMTAQQLVIMGELSPEDALAQIQAEADKAF